MTDQFDSEVEIWIDNHLNLLLHDDVLPDEINVSSEKTI